MNRVFEPELNEEQLLTFTEYLAQPFVLGVVRDTNGVIQEEEVTTTRMSLVLELDIVSYRALYLSREKWREIAYEGGEDQGVENCACCVEYNSSLNACEGCPVSIASGRAWCRNTPYTEWVLIQRALPSPHKVFNTSSRIAAVAEFKFLDKLLMNAWLILPVREDKCYA